MYASSGLVLNAAGDTCEWLYTALSLADLLKCVFHNLTLNQPGENTSNARCSVSSVIQRASLRK